MDLRVHSTFALACRWAICLTSTSTWLTCGECRRPALSSSSISKRERDRDRERERRVEPCSSMTSLSLPLSLSLTWHFGHSMQINRVEWAAVYNGNSGRRNPPESTPIHPRFKTRSLENSLKTVLNSSWSLSSPASRPVLLHYYQKHFSFYDNSHLWYLRGSIKVASKSSYKQGLSSVQAAWK